MFSSDVTPVRMLNRPLSQMPTDTTELYNCSFHIQLNLINNAYYFVYQKNKEILSCYNI